MRVLKLMSIVGVSLWLQWAGTADMGGYPLRPNVKLFEPNQRAIIAWNGSEEILLLSADIRASETLQVLQVIPFPSEPKVKEGDVASFQKAVSIINAHRLAEARTEGGLGGFGGSKGSSAEPAGKVIFHELIGGHDISVAEVQNVKGFTSWAKEYLGKQGVPNASISDEFIKMIGTYLKGHFKWFAFDIIELGAEPKTVKPIQYRFKIDHLFYPLRISSLEEGSTEIDLIIISPRLLRSFTGLHRNRIKLAHNPFSIGVDELKTINDDMAELFANRDRVMLRIWKCQGQLSDFDKDIIVWD